MKVKYAILSLTILCATNVWAEEDESFVNFERIVTELKADADDMPNETEEHPEWNEVSIFGGMAIATSFISVTAPNGANGGGMLKGFEAFVGASLLTPQARAELAFRNFAPEDFGKVHVNLREFEARLVFLPVLQKKTSLRMGFGLTARKMDIDGRHNNSSEHSEATTPASALIMGLEHKVSRSVSVGPDVAYRSALSDSFDKSAWDAAIRLNATF